MRRHASHRDGRSRSSVRSPDEGLDRNFGVAPGTTEALIEARRLLSESSRREAVARIEPLLEQSFAPPAGKVVAFCWPYKGEVDVRFAIRSFRAQGAMAALPVVVAKATPLQFRAWWPGVAMAPGALDIPVPQGTDVVTPVVAIVPLVGFDARGYRLGYGGGYFDRTLAALPAKPITIGVGYEAARLPTIYPQPHDIPMDFIATEARPACRRRREALESIDAPGAREIVTRLAATRSLW